MSDYIPNPNPGGLPGGGYEPNNRFDPPDPSGNGPYVLLAILVAVAVIGGVVYFSHGHRNAADQTAQAPAPVTTPMPAPAPMTTPSLPPGGTTGNTNAPGIVPGTPGPSPTTK